MDRETRIKNRLTIKKKKKKMNNNNNKNNLERLSCYPSPGGTDLADYDVLLVGADNNGGPRKRDEMRNVSCGSYCRARSYQHTTFPFSTR
ncbi:hypothetical protein M0802_005582 [Mischocyttarus mexicanus]|nr:hypothetical protein M0802_005582 [Mischocyttarus mexicanus]